MPSHRTRREIFRLALGAGTLLACPAVATAASGRRALAMHNLHTAESANTVYWADGRYVRDGLLELNHLLRDHRANEACDMDPRVLDQLYLLHERCRAREPFHIISGYRSPSTNAMLRSKSDGVAKKSLHMQGQAIDVRLPGVDTDHLREVALSMKAGGVGYYAKSDFVHVDTGRVRFW